MIAEEIFAGESHACAVLTDGTIRCWGDNTYGELGNGTNTPTLSTAQPGGIVSIPVMVAGITNASALSAGHNDTCAVLSDGSVQCWGANDYGQLGINSNVTTSTVPAVTQTVIGNYTGIGTITNVTAVAVGYQYSCAMIGAVQQATVSCWGHNNAGQLGIGSTIDWSIAVPVAGISNAVAIGAGTSPCAVLSTGSVQCWGNNTYGVVSGSTGTPTNSLVPRTVAGITNAKDVSSGRSHACAVLNSGQIQCWGDNSYWQLGKAATANQYDNVTVPGITTAVKVSAGYIHTCAVLSDGSIQCWGENSLGQLGIGTETSYKKPVTVVNITNAVDVRAGNQYTCALLSTGSVQCWGGLTGSSTKSSELPSGGLVTASTTPVTVDGF